MRGWLGFPFFLIVAALVLPACNTVSDVGQMGTADAQTVSELRVDGSSTVFPITDAIAQKFRQSEPDAKITVGVSGTGGGFKQFCAGETVINNASRPISLEEMEACKEAGVPYIEIPVAFDALTVVVNPQNTWATDLTIEELKRIWEPAAEGKITNWNQVRASFPDRPLELYGPGTASGTYDYFTDVVVGDGDSRKDYTASESDDALVKNVEANPNSLGYFGFAYFQAEGDQLKAVAINSGNGAVMPSTKAVETAQYQPFSRPLFIYVNGSAAQKNPQLRDFVAFYLRNVGQIVQQVGYVPLPDGAYQVGLGNFYRGKVGSVYDGTPQPNLTIAEVMQKQTRY